MVRAHKSNALKGWIFLSFLVVVYAEFNNANKSQMPGFLYPNQRSKHGFFSINTVFWGFSQIIQTYYV